jgi:predicted RNA-binding protein YlqC (UPF0109 family)
MTSIDEQFVDFIVKSLVGNPDEVQIARTIDEKGVLLELTVDPEDLGRVIGKRGATAQSIRTLLRALGTKNDARYNLKIVDNGVGGGSRRDDEHASSAQSSAPAVSDDDDAPVVVDDVVANETEEKEVVEEKREESLAERTRKELDDLDDLDV